MVDPATGSGTPTGNAGGTAAGGGTPTYAQKASPGNAGKGGSSGGRSNRNRRGGRGGGGANQSGPPSWNAKTFEGSEEGLKGHNYDCVSPTDADRYARTTIKIQDYIGKNFSFGNDLSPSVESPGGGLIALAVPKEDDVYAVAGKPTAVESAIMQEKIKLYTKREATLSENNKKLFSLVKGQCTDAMIARLESTNDYAEVKRQQDGLGLLLLVKRASFDPQNKQYTPMAVFSLSVRLYTFRQQPHWTVPKYHEAFINFVEVAEAGGVTIGNDTGLLKVAAKSLFSVGKVSSEKVSSLDKAELKLVVAGARDHALACCFIMGADRQRFGLLLVELNNHHVQGQDGYPKTLTGAYELLLT